MGAAFMIFYEESKREGRTESVFAARRIGIHTWEHTLRFERLLWVGEKTQFDHLIKLYLSMSA